MSQSLPTLTPWVSRCALAALALLVAGVLAPTVGAQEVECERATYNERIILVCRSTGENSTTTGSNPTPTPQPTTEPDEESAADDADDDAESNVADGDDADVEDGDAADSVEDDEGETDDVDVNRDGRGGRSDGADADLSDDSPDIDEDAAATGDVGDQSTDGDSSRDDDTTEPAASDTDADGDADGDADVPGPGDGDAGAPLLAADPEPSNLPLIVGLVGFAAAGAALSVAAKRNDRAPIQVEESVAT